MGSKLAVRYPSASNEPPLNRILADPIIQKLAASEWTQPRTRPPHQEDGILAELDELAGQVW